MRETQKDNREEQSHTEEYTETNIEGTQEVIHLDRQTCTDTKRHWKPVINKSTDRDHRERHQRKNRLGMHEQKTMKMTHNQLSIYTQWYTEKRSQKYSKHTEKEYLHSIKEDKRDTGCKESERRTS